MFLTLFAAWLVAAAPLNTTPPTPREVLEGRPVSLRLTGVRPGELVSVTARSKLGDKLYGSSARFRADGTGTVDLSTAAPLSGDYAGADLRGLFWSAKPVASTAPDGLASGDTLLSWEGKSASGLHKLRLLRRDPDVVSSEVRALGVVGWFAAPKDARRAPAIIVLGGSEGGVGFARARAERLASEGFAALGVAYFAGSWAPIEGVPKHFEMLPVEAVQAARDWLAQRPEADVERLGVVGASKGAELALVAASIYPWIDAVAAYVPSDRAWQGFAGADPSRPARGSWSLGGEELPHVPLTRWPAQGPYTPVHEESEAAASPAVLEAAAIRLERSRAALLLLGSGRDEVWPSGRMVLRLQERLREAGYAHPVEAVVYPAAGHNITGAGWRPMTAEPLPGGYGGSAEANARAQADSFARSLRFLQRHLGDRAAVGRTIIRQATVIPMTGPGALTNRDVVVENGRIAAVSRGRTAMARPGDRVIDGRGRFLIPGLWDMHAHVLGDDADKALSDVLPRYLAQGVVGVRDMGSAPSVLPRFRALGIDAALVPQVVAAGPVLDGPKRRWQSPWVFTSENAVEVRTAVQRSVDEKADFLKPYTGLSSDQFAVVSEEARARGLPLAGHVPLGVTLDEASAAGLRSVEHATLDLFKDCTPAPRLAGRSLLDAWIGGGWAGRFNEWIRLYETHDLAACEKLYARLATRGVWFTPTLVNELRGGAWTRASDIAALTSEKQSECRSQLEDIEKAPPELRERAYRQVLELVGRVRRADVRLLAGTDAANACVAHGASLHRELELLVHAGLTPWEALRTATYNPAEYLGRTDSGRVQVGARADLVLLAANPLKDISATRQIEAVMMQGHMTHANDRKALASSVSRAR